jgi:pimeloyl-ACP methyl ester carboxylesterase
MSQRSSSVETWRKSGRSSGRDRRGHATSGGRPTRYEFSTVALRFESGEGRCQGRLYKPDRPTDPPVVILAPGVGLTWRESLRPTAEALAERGYAAFVFDYRGFGLEEPDADGVVSPTRQRTDLDAAIQEMLSVPDVDTDRIALWGTDLSAGTALAAAAEEYRVRAVVARFPVVSGGQLVPGWVGPRVKGVGSSVLDRLLSLAGRRRTMPMFGYEGETALVVGPSVVRHVERLSDEAGERRVPSRSFWALWRHGIGGSLEEVTCPTLFVAGEDDDLAPPDSVEKLSEKPANATFVRVPTDHYRSLSDRASNVLRHELAFLDAEL